MSKPVAGIVAVLLLFGVGIGFIIKSGLYQHKPKPHFHAAQLLPASKVLVSFKLEKNQNDFFTAENFTGRWSLIFFGFTSCPDFCPLELQKLGSVLQYAQTSKVLPSHLPLQVIFISLDPERDTPEKIKNYTAFFHPQMLGLSGSNSELAKIAQFFGADYSRQGLRNGLPVSIPSGVDMPENIANDYQLEHSARIFIINPQGAYIGSFAPPHNSELLWADLQLIISE
jgi:protein SCO1